jgi:TNF receptor-associated factor 4
LYLNGDADTRDQYISVFIVLMRNAYDAILTWPFPYSIKLCLINQSAPHDNERNIIHFVRPDIASGCFQRPNFDVNDGYGIKEFLSLEQFEQNKSHFVQDDTMFIEVKIDFTSENSSISSSTGELANDEEHVNTINEDFTQLS